MGGNKDNGLVMIEERCIPCEDFPGGPDPVACTRSKDYVTPEEEEVLAMLRDIKERARLLRGKIRGIEYAMGMAEDAGVGDARQGTRGNGEAQGSFATEMASCEQEMDALRETWREWEARREEANRRKLALLGHGP